MSAVWDALSEPWGHVFMQRAVIVAVICSLVCGVVGVHVVLRGMAFMGDAVSHAVFPGVAVAFVVGTDLVLGGVITGLLCAVGIAAVAQSGRLREDTVIGVFFAAMFGAGIVILSAAHGYSGSLESFLFGSVLGISDADVRLVAFAGAAVLLAANALQRHLVCVALDRESARASGLPVFALDLALYALVTVAIVISIRAVGTILVLALLITPAACARLLTERLAVMTLLAPAIGIASAVCGLYVSYHADLAAGGLIVLIATACFVVCWLLAPRHGLLARWTAGRP